MLALNNSLGKSFDIQGELQKKVIKAAKAGNKKDLQTYLKSINDPKFLDPEGRSPLHRIVESTAANTETKIDIIKILVKAGIEINAVDLNGWTSLLSAASTGDLAVCATLLKLSADPRLANEDGSTPLHYFVRHTYSEDEKDVREVVDLFVKRGLNLNTKNNFDETPLHLACLQGDDRIIRILLDLGADHSIWDRKGRTALHCAVRANRIVPCQILLGFEASFDIRAQDTAPTAKELAESLNYVNILRLFYAKDQTEYSLNILLNEEEDALVFMNYLKTEFSTENLEFWLLVRSYRLIQEESKRDQEAKMIYETWIPGETLNVRGAVKKELKGIYEQCNGRRYPADLFDSAAIDVWMNMRDSYFRFGKTKEFQDILNKYRKRLTDISERANKEISPRSRSPIKKWLLK